MFTLLPLNVSSQRLLHGVASKLDLAGSELRSCGSDRQ